MESYLEFKDRLQANNARFRHASDIEFRKSYFEHYSIWPEEYQGEGRQIVQPHQSILVTTESVSPFPVKSRLGIVSAECVLGMHVFKDIFSGLTDLFGGRSNTVQSELKKARQICLDELKKEAFSLGANAVVAISLNYSEIGGGGKSMLFLVAAGTAVIVEESV